MKVKPGEWGKTPSVSIEDGVLVYEGWHFDGEGADISINDAIADGAIEACLYLLKMAIEQKVKNNLSRNAPR
jgi:hypothetical protein